MREYKTKTNSAKANNTKGDKYSAVWLSHSTISDFQKCPRLYFLKNIWKNKNGRKVTLVSPYLSLGLAVHQTLEPLAKLKTEERMSVLESNLEKIYLDNFKKFEGKWGGFTDSETESFFREEGIKMIKNVMRNPGPISRKTIKLKESANGMPPNFFLDENEGIILNGRVDWVEYLEDGDNLRVIDFKTGKNDENEESLQLPIYKLIVESLQKRKVVSGGYWYLERDKYPKSVELLDEDMEEIKEKIIEVGKKIKKLKDNKSNFFMKDFEKNFSCKFKDGCYACREFEIIKNYEKDTDEIEYLGANDNNQDVYFLKKEKAEKLKQLEEIEEVM